MKYAWWIVAVANIIGVFGGSEGIWLQRLNHLCLALCAMMVAIALELRR